jgi:hypothetical protein
MTRAEKSPVTRVVIGPKGKELALRVEGRSFSLRPLRVRDPSAEVIGTWETLYERLLYVRAVEQEQDATPKRARRKRVTRGRLR